MKFISVIHQQEKHFSCSKHLYLVHLPR